MTKEKDFSDKVFDAFSLTKSDGFTVDEEIRIPLSVISEIFLRYLVAQTIDCMSTDKTKIEYDDIHRAILSDKCLLFLAAAFSPQQSLDMIRKRRLSQISKDAKTTKKVARVIELD